MLNPSLSPAGSPARLRRTTATLALCACAALPAFAQSAGQEPRPQRSELERLHLAEVRTRYAQPLWRQSEARAGLANALALAGWRADPIQCDAGLLTRSFRHADDAQAEPSFVLESCVEDSVAAAQERLLGWLAGLESARLAPSLDQLGISLGDVGFVGRSGAAPEAFAWLAFVRGNVAVRVSACDAPRESALDLTAIAAAVDQAIRRAPPLRAARALAKPEIATLSAARASVVAGSVLPLDVLVTDPGQGEPILQWTVGGPGQGYVERAPDGAWQLHTTGAGALHLVLEVTGSTGTWAQRELALNVLDD